MQGGTRDRHTNSEELEFECQLKTPTRGRIHELLNLGASSSHNLFQSLITNQDLLRLPTEQFPPSLTQCLTCTRVGNKKKSSRFKLLGHQEGLIFRLALPEELEWENRAEDVALSLDSIKRCLINMLTALERDTPQTKDGLTPHFLPHQ